MNPTTDEQLPPPPQPPQPHRSSTSCDRHPDEQFTGFCPSCLCERLAVLDKSAASATATTGRKSASAAIRSLFKTSDGGGGGGGVLRGRLSSSSFLPELRRTKSFSGGKNEGSFSGAFEPQRRSCDVRGRSTLFSLFSQDDVTRPHHLHHHHHHRNGNNDVPTTSTVVIKSNENVEQHHHQQQEIEEEEDEEQFHDSNGDEIQEVREEEERGGEISARCEQIEEIVEETDSAMSDLKTMKDYIDLDSQNKKGSSSSAKDLKELAGSFWSAASVFSKKLRAWTKIHKVKKHTGSQTHVHVSSKKGNAGKRNKYNYRDTQSEIADYGYGRRSCDTDPRLSFDVGRFSVDAGRYSVDAGRFSVDAGRYSIDAGRFSVDAGRISLDDPRYSFDEPRASWDGYLMGRGTGFTRMVPPPSMLSVVEDAPAPLPVVPRKDAHIPVEEPRRSSVSTVGEDCIPGCASQTKDYYSDSSSRRRKSLDRSSSIRKTAAAVVADLDEIKSNNNSNASISNNVDLREVNLNSNSLRDDCSESFDLGFRDNASVIGGGERKDQKKSKRWKAIGSIWGLLYRRGNAKDIEDDDQQYSVRANGVQRSLSESWPELRRDGGGYGGNIGNRTVFRSNSSVSWRHSHNVGGSYNHGVRKKKEDPPFVLERNRSARYSPGHAADNGMLRFYLTPMRGSRKGGGSGKPKPAYSHSFARSVLRLY